MPGGLRPAIGVAHPPLSDPIQNEGRHPGSSSYPPYLVLSKMKVASRHKCIEPYLVRFKMRGGIQDQVAIDPIWPYPK